MSASIQDIKEKFKAFIAEDVYFYTVLIIVISMLSFGLGRMSVHETQSQKQPQIVLTEQSAAVAHVAVDSSATTTTTEVVKNFVASKKGTKYHLSTCPGVKQIKEDNKVYFSSEAEAKASGYSRAKNCKF